MGSLVKGKHWRQPQDTGPQLHFILKALVSLMSAKDTFPSNIEQVCHRKGCNIDMLLRQISSMTFIWEQLCECGINHRIMW